MRPGQPSPGTPRGGLLAGGDLVGGIFHRPRAGAGGAHTALSPGPRTALPWAYGVHAYYMPTMLDLALLPLPETMLLSYLSLTTLGLIPTHYPMSLCLQ